MNLNRFEILFEERIRQVAGPEDPAHDILHFKRVVTSAKALCLEEGARPEVVVPAAWLHDLVVVPKSDPRRPQASRLSAQSALVFLQEIGFPEEYFEDIAHAIEAHSFSANIECKSAEAMIVQDADRLDGLGAIGVARCFATASLMKRPFYSESDPFCLHREADDREFTVDHFYVKLFNTAKTLKTAAGRREGERRVQVMHRFLKDLRAEIHQD